MSTSRNPLVLIHGYSDVGESFRTWREELKQNGYDVSIIRTCNYKTLTNEITIRDIAEGFDRALRLEAGLDIDQEFDAIVHSTGMLVIRTWLAAYASRRSRLKRLISLAPATFGSPLAHQGRSLLGGLFKGKREFGPDFLEAGDLVLDALELGSRYTWDLAHQDMVRVRSDDKSFYGSDADTPYVFTFCGTEGFSGISSIVNTPGSDGTIRLAGAALNSRKITLDLTVEPGRPNSDISRFSLASWTSLEIPVFLIAGLNHGTIMSKPNDQLVKLVLGALQVSNKAEFETWFQDAKAQTKPAWDKHAKWQQFIVHVVDERGNAVPDYYLEILAGNDEDDRLESFQADVHTYRSDSSFRCFHVDLEKLKLNEIKKLKIRLIASSGSQLVEYFGYGSERVNTASQEPKADGKWDAVLDISAVLTNKIEIDFFSPLTTTLIEIKLNREPMPLVGKTKLFEFIQSE
ncbi:hypothetical protein H6F76_25155 [Leptolyngbya sp. FACHB-321]|nr:hypothetical protein [Leptolyngbya sp. FACHB-321]